MARPSPRFIGRSTPALVGLMALGIIAAACGSAAGSEAISNPPADAVGESEIPSDSGGLRLVSALDGAAIAADPPQNLVILDVRTPDEFAEGHIEGAVMLDFYEPDFAEKLSELDPDVPYLLYCRSGNRSGQTLTIMERLGFGDVAEIDGGILNWADSGQPVVAG